MFKFNFNCIMMHNTENRDYYAQQLNNTNKKKKKNTNIYINKNKNKKNEEKINNNKNYNSPLLLRHEEFDGI